MTESRRDQANNGLILDPHRRLIVSAAVAQIQFERNGDNTHNGAGSVAVMVLRVTRQYAIKERIQSLANSLGIVAALGRQQSAPDQLIDLALTQFYQ
jgi:hypothetical protein